MNYKSTLILSCFISIFFSCQQAKNNPAVNKIESSAAVAEKPTKAQSPEDKAKVCDEAVKRIDAISLKKVSSRYQNPKPELYYDMAFFHAFYNAEDMLKLVEIVGEEGYITTSTYYFKNKKLFYCSTVSSYFNSDYLARRDYIEDEKIYRIAAREKEPQDETTDFGTLKEILLDDKAVKNTSEGFKKGFAETMKRFKASKVE